MFCVYTYVLYITDGSDYYIGSYSIAFPAGETKALFTVLIADDDIPEQNEIFKLYINSATLPSGVKRRSPYSLSVSIKDDDCKLMINKVCNLLFHKIHVYAHTV